MSWADKGAQGNAARNNSAATIFMHTCPSLPSPRPTVSSVEDSLCRKEREVLAALERLDKVKLRLQVGGGVNGNCTPWYHRG